MGMGILGATCRLVCSQLPAVLARPLPLVPQVLKVSLFFKSFNSIFMKGRFHFHFFCSVLFSFQPRSINTSCITYPMSFKEKNQEKENMESMEEKGYTLRSFDIFSSCCFVSILMKPIFVFTVFILGVLFPH